jgi:hypothetical protein
MTSDELFVGPFSAMMTVAGHSGDPDDEKDLPSLQTWVMLDGIENNPTQSQNQGGRS